jgi:hypothetical protein
LDHIVIFTARVAPFGKALHSLPDEVIKSYHVQGGCQIVGKPGCIPQLLTAFENLANGNGEAKRRELEIVDLLRFIKYNEIKTAVHQFIFVCLLSTGCTDENLCQDCAKIEQRENVG